MTKKETDILDQLLEIPRGIGGAYHDVVQRAAVEIERLRKERDELQKWKDAHNTFWRDRAERRDAMREGEKER